MPKRIFISYAREDHGFACEVYSKLKAKGFDPWMDKPPAPYDLDGIRPGEHWKVVLERQIRAADLMILILSAASVAKVGYVQVEFGLALHVMSEMPPGKRFAIPILREPCEIPDHSAGNVRLRDLHWVEIYVSGLERFVEALGRE
jgi:TIR domain